MKLKKVEPQFNDGWSNSPGWVVEFDESVPEVSKMRHTVLNGLYLAHEGEYAHFLYSRGPSTGYGGATFELTMEDGSIAKLIGPWSSRAGAINSEYHNGDLWVVDVSIRTPEFKNCNLAGAATMLGMKRQCHEQNQPYAILCDEANEITMVPIQRREGGALWMKGPEAGLTVVEVYDGYHSRGGKNA